MREFRDDIRAAKKSKKKKSKEMPPEKIDEPAKDDAPPPAPESAPPVIVAPSLGAATSAASETATDGWNLRFRVEGVRIHFLPILWAALIGLVLPVFASVVVDEFSRLIPMPGRLSHYWSSIDYDYVGQLLLTLGLIQLFRRRIKSDFGLLLPSRPTYVPSALLWGVFIGIVSGLAIYAPNLLAHTPPSGFRLTRADIWGWLSLKAVMEGVANEPLYRGLLVTYLMARTSGRIGLGRYDISMATVIVAVIAMMANLSAFIAYSPLIALAQELAVFMLAIACGYWLEKSKSLLAPIVGHNVSETTQYFIALLLVRSAT